jgi:hypothetical protein
MSKCPIPHNDDNPYMHPKHVRERDIDLLLLEELYSSDKFQTHFLDLLRSSAESRSPHKSLPSHIKFQAARRSIWDEYGQCDLLVKLNDKEERCWLLLIEDKIDAELQPSQADRYRERGEEYKRSGCCCEYLIALAAPWRYLAKGDKGWDAIISYEDVRKWFDDARELRSRRPYKLALLDAALAAKQPASVAFFEFYLKRVPSELRASKSAKRVKFQPPCLPEGVFIVHRLMKGWVELRSARPELVGQPIENGMIKVKVGEHLAMRLDVTPIDLKNPFAPQERAVEEGIAAAQRLLRWFSGTARNGLLR